MLSALPKEAQQDFVTDASFTVLLGSYTPGEGSSAFMTVPEASVISSRSVGLSLRLSTCEEAFAHYVIADEFAHAPCGMGRGAASST